MAKYVKRAQKVCIAAPPGMSREVFTSRMEKHGLWKRGMGYDGVLELGELIKAPSPMLHGKGVCPFVLRKASILIAAGFARLNREAGHYEATEEGQKWHAKVMKLLPQKDHP